ncbi:MAG: hypothetical protein E7473_05980 [Ruminococcaceae bacterium]|nr:hypothetical protein [Oscillospiraceae bacterium]
MGEILPSDQSVYFDEVMELMEEREEPFRYYVVMFTMAALIPGIIFLISSLFKIRPLCIISSAGGVVAMLYYLFKFIEQNSADDVFQFDNTAICIGFWITLILFMAGCVSSVAEKKKTENVKNDLTVDSI